MYWYALLLFLKFYFLLTYLCVWVCMGTCISRHTCEGQRPPWCCWFSPYTVRVLEVELRSSRLLANIFTFWASLLTLSHFLKIGFLTDLLFSGSRIMTVCFEGGWSEVSVGSVVGSQWVHEWIFQHERQNMLDVPTLASHYLWVCKLVVMSVHSFVFLPIFSGSFIVVFIVSSARNFITSRALR